MPLLATAADSGNGPSNDRKSRGAATKARELTRSLTKEQAIEKLYLSTLSRRPSSEETARMLLEADGQRIDAPDRGQPIAEELGDEQERGRDERRPAGQRGEDAQ